MKKEKTEKPENDQQEQQEPAKETKNAAADQYMDPAEAKECTECKSQAEDEKAKLQQKVDYYIDIARRTQADFENYRKRNLSARAEALAEGKTETVKAFLPVIDDIDRALSHVKEVDAISEGLRLVRRQIDKALGSLKVEEIGSVGEKFDPNFHEAVMQVPPQEGQESGVIAEVFRKGYKMGDKVLRYTMVKVTE